MADIGLIGLGTMGANLALNIAENGYRVAVWNRTHARTQMFIAGAGALAWGALGVQVRRPFPSTLIPAGFSSREKVMGSFTPPGSCAPIL